MIKSTHIFKNILKVRIFCSKQRILQILGVTLQYLQQSYIFVFLIYISLFNLLLFF